MVVWCDSTRDPVVFLRYAGIEMDPSWQPVSVTAQ